MDTNQIHQLLVKYFEGNSSLAEEKVLQHYFAANEIDASLLQHKKQFDVLRAGREISFDIEKLESRILSGIEKYEMQMRPPAVKKLNISRFLVAASIAIIITLSGIVLLRNQKNKLQDTFSDPQLAYIETQKALLYVSNKMNKGMEPLSNITKISKGTDQLKKLEKMDESLGMLNLVSFINQSSNLKK